MKKFLCVILLILSGCNYCDNCCPYDEIRQTRDLTWSELQDQARCENERAVRNFRHKQEILNAIY